MDQFADYIYRYSDYNDKAIALSRAKNALNEIEELKEKNNGLNPAVRIGQLYLEAGLIFLKHAKDKKYEDLFKLALVHYPETAFVLAGISSTIALNPSLAKMITEIVNRLDTGIHEDGSMESAIPYYEHIVKKSAFIYAGPAKQLSRTIDKIGIKQGVLVDIGTGPAPFTIALHSFVPKSFSLIGYDVSKRMLDVAKGRILALDLDIDLVLGPIIDPDKESGPGNALPFQSESVDIITSHGSMHHWGGGADNPSSIQAMLKELLRILKPNGRILIYDINPLGIATQLIAKSNILKLLNRRYQHNAFVHSAQHSLNAGQIGSLIKQCAPNASHRISPAWPLIPTGLIFHLIEMTKEVKF